MYAIQLRIESIETCHMMERKYSICIRLWWVRLILSEPVRFQPKETRTEAIAPIAWQVATFTHSDKVRLLSIRGTDDNDTIPKERVEMVLKVRSLLNL
jgi:hypothetical protein